MQTITSGAGTRLAKAKVVRDREQRDLRLGGDNWAALCSARHEFSQASEALADELVEQGFHDLDGEG